MIQNRYLIVQSIGKGGMGGKTLAGLREHGAVYLNAIGGAAHGNSLHKDVEQESSEKLRTLIN